MTVTIPSPSILDQRPMPQQQKLFLESLIVDDRVQRTVDPAWVQRKLRTFQPNGLGTVTVSARKDGTYHIIDGQHRVELCRQFGYKQPINCLVYKSLTLSEEALMFLVLNDRRVVPPLDRFKVRVIQGDETAVALNDLLISEGWTLRNSKQLGSFSAISHLEKVYIGWGRVPAKNLGVCKSVLSVIKGAWDLDANGPHSAIVTGLGLLFIKHGDRVDIGKLTAELSAFSGGPRALWGRARALKDLSNGRIGDSVATILVNLLNRGRRSSATKLPSWMESEEE